MNVDRFTEKLVLLMDDDLGKEERTEVEAHLKKCKACAREFRLMKKTLSLTRTDEAPEFKLKEWAEPSRSALPLVGWVRYTPGERLRRVLRGAAWIPLAAAALLFAVIFGGDAFKTIPETSAERLVIAGTDSLSESEGQALAMLILSQDENLKADLLSYEEQSPRNIYSYVGELGEDEEEAFVSLVREQFKNQEGVSL